MKQVDRQLARALQNSNSKLLDEDSEKALRKLALHLIDAGKKMKVICWSILLVYAFASFWYQILSSFLFCWVPLR